MGDWARARVRTWVNSSAQTGRETSSTISALAWWAPVQVEVEAPVDVDASLFPSPLQAVALCSRFLVLVPRARTRVWARKPERILATVVVGFHHHLLLLVRGPRRRVSLEQHSLSPLWGGSLRVPPYCRCCSYPASKSVSGSGTSPGGPPDRV